MILVPFMYLCTYYSFYIGLWQNCQIHRRVVRFTWHKDTQLFWISWIFWGIFFIEAFTRLLQSSEVHISIKCLNLLPPAWFIGWVLLWLRLETLGVGRVCQPECILDAAVCILRYYQFSWCLQKHCIIQLIACKSTIYKTQMPQLSH